MSRSANVGLSMLHHQRTYARAQKEAAERVLAERSATFRTNARHVEAGLDDVRRALPEGAALVSFVRYNHSALVDRTADQPLSRALTTSPSYIAFVLRSDQPEPIIVRLGSARQIDAAISAWRQNLISGLSVQGAGLVQAERSLREPGSRLRRRIWDPVSTHLNGVTHVFIVPDSAINLVPLTALPYATGGYLLEHGPVIHYLSAERDLTSSFDRRGGVSDGLLVVGGPAFTARTAFGAFGPTSRSKPNGYPDRDLTAKPNSSGETTTPPNVSAFRGASSLCATFQNMQFPALPAAAREAEDVAALWKTLGSAVGNAAADALIGSAATESAVKQLAPGHRILHLATHGFFLGDECTSPLDGTRAVGGIVSEPASASNARRRAVSPPENPLVLSGLAFAGANLRAAAGADEDDGILTAEEVASLDLTGVEWAVLSACDTGLGRIRAGEGVLGLRRAFHVAGAHAKDTQVAEISVGRARMPPAGRSRNSSVQRSDVISAVWIDSSGVQPLGWSPEPLEENTRREGSSNIRLMRSALPAVLTCAALAVATHAAAPQRIVFTRVFPNEGQIGLFIAARDGSGERPLLTPRDMDYDPVWAPDGQSIVFTSDREGSADLFRVKPDGSGLERLTDSPAYDDQAAFSPDGRQLVLVTTRAGGRPNLWTLDIATRRTTPLTSGEGGDFRPSWSPDGLWIAFSSSRGRTLTFAHGRWEHLQFADIYIVHPDGTGLKQVGERGNFCGSPKWTADSRHLIAYCMDVQKTLETRRAVPLPGNDTRIVSIDVATGTTTDVPAGPGVKFNPSLLSANEIGYVRKDSDDPGIYYTSGARGPRGQVRAASWSPDGSQVVFHRRQAAPTTWWKNTWSRNSEFQLALTSILPSFGRDGNRFVVGGRPPAGSILGSSIAIATPESNEVKVVYQDVKRNVLAPQWAPNGDKIIFSVGVFNAFYNGFNGLFLKQGDRAEGGAQVAIINPDGTGFRELTKGPNNSAFPSMAPDGKRFVYRTFGPEGDGLKIVNIESNAATMLTKGYDNFPLWSPRGDLIMFTRLAEGDYNIYTIKPDGTGLKRITNSNGNDAHQAWSPDGEQIVLASSRMGFKDEGVYTDAPQPYGELFVMRFDGTGVRQLTDNQWEDGTPAWQPAVK